MKPRGFRGVLFDLDGTLLDTLEDIATCVNRALEANGFPAHPLAAYRRFVGDGVRALIARALPPGRRDAATRDRVIAAYRAAYARGWNVRTRPYPGIPEALEALASGGLVLGVLSNKPHVFTRRCVFAYLGRRRFRVVLGQRDAVALKPDPAGALEAARRMGLQPREILYVGDTAVDMETANAAGMFALGVTWGFRTERELRAHGARAILRRPSRLPFVAGVRR